MAVCKFTMLSTVLKGPTDFNVILPEPKRGIPAAEYYSSGEKFKVLWLLHGGNGTSDTWLHDSKINIYVRGKPIIVVMPSAMNSSFVNHPEFGTGFMYEDFFFNDLMPFVHGWLPASSKREDNYICGLSMGGSGTFQFVMKHPEKFGGMAPLSCGLRPGAQLEKFRDYTGAEFMMYALQNLENMAEYSYKPAVGMSLQEINGIAKYPTVGDYIDSFECTENRYRELADKLPSMYYACGMDDPGFAGAQKIKAIAEEKGVTNATFEFFPGHGHNSFFWDIALEKVLNHFHLID